MKDFMITPDLSIIMPAYLEAENLTGLLPRLNQTLFDLKINFEILVVDTQEAMDQTPSICKRLSARYINRLNGNTYGDAVQTGIQDSKGRYVVFMDADGSHSPEFIKKLWEARKNFDVVIASRYIKGGQTDNSKTLVLMSRMVNWGYGFVLGLRCKDISNSFKLYDGEKLRALRLCFKNFDIVEEILYKLILIEPKLRIHEIPFRFEQRNFGTTKRHLVAFVFSYAVSLFKLRFISLESSKLKKGQTLPKKLGTDPHKQKYPQPDKQ